MGIRLCGYHAVYGLTPSAASDLSHLPKLPVGTPRAGRGFFGDKIRVRVDKDPALTRPEQVMLSGLRGR